MALVTRLEQIGMEMPRVHGEVEATIACFDAGGKKYLQINTYGSEERKLKGKQSQTIQLNAESVAQLTRIFAQEF